MGARRICGPLSSILALAVSAALAGQPAPGHFADIGRIVCAEGAERYLPGDYYFCAANKALQRGNADKAVAMYGESAKWGDKRAMFNLGLLYLRGEGVARDEPLALAWLALSAERKDDLLQKQVLVAAWQAASPGTRAAADALWNRMKPVYSDAVALPRARQRYERETTLLRRELQRDPTISKRIVGMRPAGTSGDLLAALDAAAEETILRAGRPTKGAVSVGAPETVRTPPPAKP